MRYVRCNMYPYYLSIIVIQGKIEFLGVTNRPLHTGKSPPTWGNIHVARERDNWEPKQHSLIQIESYLTFFFCLLEWNQWLHRQPHKIACLVVRYHSLKKSLLTFTKLFNNVLLKRWVEIDYSNLFEDFWLYSVRTFRYRFTKSCLRETSLVLYVMGKERAEATTKMSGSRTQAPPVLTCTLVGFTMTRYLSRARAMLVSDDM